MHNRAENLVTSAPGLIHKQADVYEITTLLTNLQY